MLDKITRCKNEKCEGKNSVDNLQSDTLFSARKLLGCVRGKQTDSYPESVFRVGHSRMRPREEAHKHTPAAKSKAQDNAENGASE